MSEEFAGPIVDKSGLGPALSVLSHDPDNPPYATCPADGEPLISTLKYRGVEFVCMVCGTGYGFLSPKPAPATQALTNRLAVLQARFNAGDEPGSVAHCADALAGRECRRCEHRGCGWCDECHPEIPEW